MANHEQFTIVFERLKGIMQTYEPDLRINENQAEKYSLPEPFMPQYKKDLWFGKVEIGKRYVSYHLITVYMYPDRLDGISEGLRKRMQGKSCFNFSTVNEPLFGELADLTRRSVDRLRTTGILGFE